MKLMEIATTLDSGSIDFDTFEKMVITKLTKQGYNIPEYGPAFSYDVRDAYENGADVDDVVRSLLASDQNVPYDEVQIT